MTASPKREPSGVIEDRLEGGVVRSERPRPEGLEAAAASPCVLPRRQPKDLRVMNVQNLFRQDEQRIREYGHADQQCVGAPASNDGNHVSLLNSICQ